MTRHLLTVTALLSLASPSRLLANADRLNSMDNEAVARGYAFVASADSPSAVYYNPAGLGLLEQNDSVNNLYAIHIDTHYQAAGKPSIDTHNNNFVTPAGFVAFPVAHFQDRPVTVGLGLYSPFGLSTKWPTGSSFNTFATENTVRYLTGTVAVGFTIRPHLTFGAGVSLNDNRSDLNRAIGLTPGDQLHFRGEGQAPSYNAGLLYQPTAQHSFGVSYTSKTDFHLKGMGYLNPYGVAFHGNVNWQYPDNVVLGYSFRPTSDWNFELDYDWTQWSRAQTSTLTSSTFPTTVIPFHYKNSSYTELGATRSLGDWHVSTGVLYSTNSVPDSSFNPSVPDMTRTILNAGVGYTYKNWIFSGLIQYVPTTTRTISGQPADLQGQTVNGTYTTHMYAFGVSLHCRL